MGFGDAQWHNKSSVNSGIMPGSKDMKRSPVLLTLKAMGKCHLMLRCQGLQIYCKHRNRILAPSAGSLSIIQKVLKDCVFVQCLVESFQVLP